MSHLKQGVISKQSEPNMISDKNEEVSKQYTDFKEVDHIRQTDEDVTTKSQDQKLKLS